MLVEQLKSKIHLAMITRGDVQYEGSIEIPADLMAAVDLWPGEKVLVASVTSGNRLETYALQKLLCIVFSPLPTQLYILASLELSALLSIRGMAEAVLLGHPSNVPWCLHNHQLLAP